MPDTLLAWYRKLIASKFDGSKFRKSSGRPRTDDEIERLVVRMAKENPGWGYDRIMGAMANLGYQLSDQTVGNILRHHDIPPTPKRKQTASWKDFIRAHMAVMAATDFFTVEVLTMKGLLTYYVLFFIHQESRRICLAGITRHPDQEWMDQMARNVTMEDSGFLTHCRYLLHDRDTKYCSSFRQLIEVGRVRTLALPARSPTSMLMRNAGSGQSKRSACRSSSSLVRVHCGGRCTTTMPTIGRTELFYRPLQSYIVCDKQVTPISPD